MTSIYEMTQQQLKCKEAHLVDSIDELRKELQEQEEELMFVRHQLTIVKSAKNKSFGG